MIKNYWSLIIALLLFISACDTKLPIDEYEEPPIVYCLLNIKDSVHYVRVDKGFLTGDNAYNYVQTMDSVSYPPEDLEVSLEEYTDTTLQVKIRDISFIHTPDVPKDSGLFYNERNNIYSSRAILDKTMSRYYVLKIKNSETGHIATAGTYLMGHYDVNSEFTDMRTEKRNLYVPESIDYEYGSLHYLHYDERTFRFLYYEYPLDMSDTIKKYLDWKQYYGYPKSTLSDSLQYSDNFFIFLRDNIEEDPNKIRFPVGVDKMITIANEELQTYLYNYNHPYDPHYNPSYTNVESGLGIFSSRYHYTYHAQSFTDRTRDSVVNGRYTKNLNFQ